MKNASYLIIILLIPLILTACIGPVSPALLDDPSPRQEIPDSNDNLRMHVEKSEIEWPASNINLQIINTGESLFGYGEFFYIEKKVEGKWYMLAFDNDIFSDFSDFDNYGKVISPDEIEEVEIDPEEYLLILDSGDYRIVKAFRYHNDTQVFWLKDEFKVI